MKAKISCRIRVAATFVLVFFLTLRGYGQATTTLTLANATTAVGASNVTASLTKVPVHAFNIVANGTSGSGTLTNFTFTATGTYTASEIANFKIWSNTANSLTGATLLGTNSAPAGPTVAQTFPAFSRVINFGVTMYFWITMDVASSITNGHTLTVNASINTNMTTTMTKAGSAIGSGTQTLTVLTATLPYTENFDGAWTNAPTIPTYPWSSIGTGNNEWHRNDYTTGWTSTSGSYTPIGANSTANSARFHSYNAASATIGSLITTLLDFSPVGNKKVDFYYINTSGTDKLRVYLSTDGGTTYGAAITPTPLSTSASWTLYTCDLGSSTSNIVKIKFEATSDYGTTDIGLDQVYVYVCAAPSAQASVYTSSAITANSMTVGWSRGNGQNVLVVARAGSAVNADPIDGSTYIANATFGSGTQIGTGNFVVYNGTGTSVNITGLSSTTTYYYAIYEYNTCTGTMHNMTELTGNATTPACVSPSIQASVFGSSAITQNTMTVNWTRGNGTNVIVVARSGSAVNADPVDGTSYSDNSIFGLGSEIGTGNFVVYNGTGTSVNITGFTSSTTYYFAIYEYNACSNLYNPNELTGNASTTVCNTPTIAPTMFSASSITSSSMMASWSRGNGSNVMVVARAILAPTDPLNGTSYTASAAYGIGSPCGGGFVVYSGTGTSVSVTGLTPGTIYYFAIYEFNACDNGKYYMTELTGNGTTTSAPASSNIDYIFTSTSGTFTANSGGTSLCSAGCDSYLSGAITLPFTFYFGNCVTSTAYTQVKISANGWLGLGTGATGTSLYDCLTSTVYGPIIAPFSDDLLNGTGCNINYVTTGSSPNRVFTAEWLNMNRWSVSGTFSFQVKLYETSNNIEFVYNKGTCVYPDVDGSAAVGLNSGVAGDYYSLRDLTASPLIDYGPAATQNLQTFPASAQIYSWALPTSMTYISSSVTQASTANTFATANNQAVVGVQIVVSGSCSPINLTQMLISMNGTTSISDVSNIDVYYTGNYSSFSANEIFGTISPGTGSFTVTGSKQLKPGTNYFWIVYDISPSAVVGDVVDAECSQITVNGAAHVPSGNPPSGSRPIAAIPQTFAKWIELGRAWDVIPTSDGNILWVGVTYNTYSSGNGDAYFIKTNPDLTSVFWTRVIGFAASDEILKNVVQTSDGFISVGSSNIAGNYDIFVAKVNNSGVLQWAETFGTGGSDEGFGICKTSDGNVAICTQIDDGGTDQDGHIIKINNSTGAIIDQKSIDVTSTGLYPHTIIQTTDSGFLVGGKTSDNDFYVAKLTSALAFDWGKKWGGGSTDEINFIAENAAND